MNRLHRLAEHDQMEPSLPVCLVCEATRHQSEEVDMKNVEVKSNVIPLLSGAQAENEAMRAAEQAQERRFWQQTRLRPRSSPVPR